MIKCNVSINGVISRSGEVRTNNDGKAYLSFFVCVNVANRDGEPSKQYIAVYYDKDDLDAAQLHVGRRVNLTGTLSFKKRGENMYINLSADTIDINSAAEEFSVKGTMQFRGGVGKQIEVKADKNGKPMLVFSAFSAEKVGEAFEFVWVRFIGFGIAKEEWLEPKSKIEASGELELSAFNGKLNIGCRLGEYKQYVSAPF